MKLHELPWHEELRLSYFEQRRNVRVWVLMDSTSLHIEEIKQDEHYIVVNRNEGTQAGPCATLDEAKATYIVLSRMYPGSDLSRLIRREEERAAREQRLMQQ